MATSAGEIEVILSLAGDQFKKSLGDVENKLGSFESGAKKFAATLGAVFSAKQIFDFGKAAFQAFGEQEAALVKLNQAMANMGIYSQSASKDLQDFATQMQATTVYADEQVTATQAQLVAFGLQGKQLKEVTKATLDLASAKGIDLASAAQLLGKAFVGETGALSRYGIVIDENIPKNEKFAAVMGKVNGMFGGQAEKERMTALGQLKAMENTYGELMETIGGLIAGPATAFMKWLSDVIKNVDSAIQTISSAGKESGNFFSFIQRTGILALTAILQTVIEVFRWVEQGIIRVISSVPGVQFLLQKVGIDLTTLSGTVNAAFASADTWIADQGIKLQGLSNKWMQNGNTAVATEQKKKAATIDYVNSSNQAFMQMTAKWEEATAAQGAAWEKYQANLHIGQKAWAEMFTTSTKEVATKFASIVDNMFTEFGRAMADVIVDSKSFSEAMKQVWKNLVKSLIAEIVTLIAKLIIAVALKSALGFGGASMAEVARSVVGLNQLAGKSGMATGGLINEPSVLTGLKSGKSHLVGEAGAEAVIPLGGSGSGANKSAAEMGTSFAGAMDSGGGGITINISGQFLEGDQSSWSKLFREKIIPEIKRSTMSNPTGNFNRRRGATT